MIALTERLIKFYVLATGQLSKRPERGANLVEYALLMALIVVACLSAVATFGRSVPAEGFERVSSTI